jgi:hypothetical protein
MAIKNPELESFERKVRGSWRTITLRLGRCSVNNTPWPVFALHRPNELRTHGPLIKLILLN